MQISKRMDEFFFKWYEQVIKELLKKRDEAIEHVCGSEPRICDDHLESSSPRPDSTSWCSIRCTNSVCSSSFLEIIGIEGWIPALDCHSWHPHLELSDVQEALASVINRQLGFQVLTSLAVIGACGLMMWEEALIVSILVALTAHLEGDALMKAREAMQGGLDRLPRVARRVKEKQSFAPSAISVDSLRCPIRCRQ